MDGLSLTRCLHSAEPLVLKSHSNNPFPGHSRPLPGHLKTNRPLRVRACVVCYKSSDALNYAIVKLDSNKRNALRDIPHRTIDFNRQSLLTKSNPIIFGID